ncbi:MAG: YwqG family protein [Planctomycetota bacterium]|nr:YwqG family protein [Planctomycetota bacterium]
MLCETRIGGCPDLPKKVEWPVSSEGPLAFIAQLNLTEVPDFPAKKVLPRKGMLLFFYAPYSLQWGSDPAYIDRWRVMFFDDPHVNIASREFPSDLPEEYRYTPCGVHFRRQMTLPSLWMLVRGGSAPRRRAAR